MIGFFRVDKTERYCRNGEEIGDKYNCTYGCPVNANGQGICAKVMTVMFPIMEAVRSGGDLQNIGGDSRNSKVVVCPDCCVMNIFDKKKLVLYMTICFSCAMIAGLSFLIVTVISFMGG